MLKLIMASVNKGLDTSDENFVHGTTGPSQWTMAIRNVLQLRDPDEPDKEVRAFAIMGALRYNSTTAQLAKDLGLCFVEDRFFEGKNVVNTQGSVHWQEEGYFSWVTERQALQGQAQRN